jgi:TolA-binding protein
MTSQLGDIADRKSPAYYIVMRAQEREVFSRAAVALGIFTAARRSLLEQELQRFGDEKELAVKKTEREIRALRSTLERLNSKNQRFKQSFTKVEGDSEEVAEMEQLQPVLEAVGDRRRQARTEVEHLSGDVASMQGSLGNLMQETASIDRQVQGLRKRVDSVQVGVFSCGHAYARVNAACSVSGGSQRTLGQSGPSAPDGEKDDGVVPQARASNARHCHRGGGGHQAAGVQGERERAAGRGSGHRGGQP